MAREPSLGASYDLSLRKVCADPLKNARATRNIQLNQRPIVGMFYSALDAPALKKINKMKQLDRRFCTAPLMDWTD